MEFWLTGSMPVLRGRLYYFVTHIRVVVALVVRETSTRFGTKPGGYIWAFLDPAAHIAFMALIFMAIAHRPALGTSFPLFFATGYIAFQFYQGMVRYLNSAISANRALLTYPNIAPIDTILARYILQFGTTVVVACCVFATLALMLREPLTIQWPYVIEAAFAASLLALGGAFANCVMFYRYPLYEKVYEIVTRPLFLVSGVFYLPDSLPHPAREIILLNPLTHVLMLFRKGFYPQYRAIGFDTGYLYGIAFSLLFIGMSVFTSFRGVLRGR